MVTLTGYGAASSQRMVMRSSPEGLRWSSVRGLLCFHSHSVLKKAYIVYDLLADRRTVKIRAHGDDINSCCWADTASGNVLVSASDDTFLKVWYVSYSLSSHPSPTYIYH